jgi:D-aminopeptidase
MMPEGAFRKKEVGSIIVYIGTDAPLSPLSLKHIARRASIGVGRGGTPSGNSSGDIFLAFSVANPGQMPHFAPTIGLRAELNGECLDPLYLASVEAVEEAVVNALVAGVDVAAVNPKGLMVRGIDTEELAAIFKREMS